MVTISYTIRKTTTGQGFTRNILSKMFYKLLNKISDIGIGAGEADYRLISPRIADIFKNQIRRNQFIRGLVRWVGFNSASIIFHAGPRKKGSTKYSFARILNFAVLGVISFSRAPLQYAICLGIILSFIGF